MQQGVCPICGGPRDKDELSQPIVVGGFLYAACTACIVYHRMIEAKNNGRVSMKDMAPRWPKVQNHG